MNEKVKHDSHRRDNKTPMFHIHVSWNNNIVTYYVVSRIIAKLCYVGERMKATRVIRAITKCLISDSGVVTAGDA